MKRPILSNTRGPRRFRQEGTIMTAEVPRRVAHTEKVITPPRGAVMELGLTFPLQRFLKMKPPACGAASDRRFCWDLHVIRLRGRVCLLAVHCHSRYAFVRYDVPPLLWADLPELFLAGLRESLTAAGFAQEQISGYLRSAETISITRTHGRREVAFLNRAWEDVLALDLCLDTAQQAQPLLDHAVNTRPSRCAGSAGLGTGLERMAKVVAGQAGGSPI